jgi:acetate kinase
MYIYWGKLSLSEHINQPTVPESTTMKAKLEFKRYGFHFKSLEYKWIKLTKLLSQNYIQKKQIFQMQESYWETFW